MGKGLPHLQDEAARVFSKSATHNGYSYKGIQQEMVTFSTSRDVGGRWETTSFFVDSEWVLQEYGDQLSWEHDGDDIKDDLSSAGIEKNQCMILHLAAGLELSQDRT